MRTRQIALSVTDCLSYNLNSSLNIGDALHAPNFAPIINTVADVAGRIFWIAKRLWCKNFIGGSTMSQNKPKKYPKKRQRQNRKWQPILLALGGLLLVALAFLALRDKPAPGAAIEVTGAPSLQVDNEKVDLGDVKLNQTVQVSFQLPNVGDETLRFVKQPYIEVVEGC